MGNRNNKIAYGLVGIYLLFGLAFFGLAAICIPALLQHARTPIPVIGTFLCMILTIVYICKVSAKKEMNRRRMFQIMVIAGLIQFLIYLPIASWSYPYSFAEDTLCKFMIAFMNQPTIYFIGRKIADS